jgi:hypothetical protein
MSDWLDHRLELVAAGAVILYSFCIWEFTIGIKKSIKQLYRGNILLDMCRYSAILYSGRGQHEPTKHSKTDSDHSGFGGGKFD